MSTLDEVGAYLEAEGVGTVGTDIFLGQLAHTPDDQVAVYEFEGAVPTFVHDAGVPISERPRIQAIARNESYSVGRTKIEAVYTALNKVANQALSATTYHRIFPLQPPFFLKRDENDRVLFACNFQVLKAVS